MQKKQVGSFTRWVYPPEPERPKQFLPPEVDENGTVLPPDGWQGPWPPTYERITDAEEDR